MNSGRPRPGFGAVLGNPETLIISHVHLWISIEMAAVFGMCRAKFFGYENINRLTDKLIVRIAKHPFDFVVGRKIFP